MHSCYCLRGDMKSSALAVGLGVYTLSPYCLSEEITLYYTATLQPGTVSILLNSLRPRIVFSVLKVPYDEALDFMTSHICKVVTCMLVMDKTYMHASVDGIQRG